jgi:hypothetical protein
VKSAITLVCDKTVSWRMKLRYKKLLNYQKNFSLEGLLIATIDLYSEVLKSLCDKNASRLV